MNLPWVVDPKEGHESVSVTVVVIATLAMVVAIGLELAGKAKATSLVTDFFWGSLANYCGRTFLNGKGAKLGPTPTPDQGADK